MKKKEMIPLTDKENTSYEKQKVCYICKKEFSIDENDNKKMSKIKRSLSLHWKIQRSCSQYLQFKIKTPKEISVVFHNGSTYDYHFIVKQPAKEFDGRFECLGENTEKYIAFSVPIN